MNRHCLVFAIAVSATAALAHTNAWRIVGSVKEPCVVSVALHPFLYHHVTAGMADALERELRIQDHQGRDVAYAIRPKVERTDSHSVARPNESSAPADEIGFGVNACGQKTDVGAKKTVFEINSAFMPVTGIRLNVEDGNFSRHVRVMRRVRTGWVSIAQGNVCSVHLSNTQKKSLELSLPGECREERMRIEVDDRDNPPISYGDTPVTAFVKPYELVFISSPGESYSLAIHKGAEKPNYDLPILEDATRMVEPVQWRIQFSEMWVDGVLNDHGPTAIWMTADPVSVVSVVVFIVLGVICFLLIRRIR